MGEGLPDLGIDLRYRKGSEMGTETIDGQPVEVVATGETAYIKADRSFWRTYQGVDGDLFATRLGGKYLKVKTNDPRFNPVTGLLGLREVLTGSMLQHTDISKGDRKVVNGVPTIGLIGGDKSVLYVATQGPPYPIRLDSGAGQGAIDFLDYGKVFDIKAPPDDQVVNISTLT
jgi:hypothetical protein